MKKMLLTTNLVMDTVRGGDAASVQPVSGIEPSTIGWLKGPDHTVVAVRVSDLGVSWSVRRQDTLDAVGYGIEDTNAVHDTLSRMGLACAHCSHRTADPDVAYAALMGARFRGYEDRERLAALVGR
jgi:hypothetical protein